MKARTVIALFLALAMALPLAACGQDTPTNTSSGAQGSEGNVGSGKEVNESVVQKTIDWWRGPMETYTTADTGLKRTLPDDTLVIRLSMVIGCDPNSYLDEHSWCNNVYESLLQKDLETGEVKAMLATDWGYNDDGTYHLTLRDDVTFHSGNHMTAKDILYSFQRIANYAGNKAATAMAAIDFEKCIMEDDYNLTIVFKEPSPTVETILSTGYASIVDSAFLEEVGPDYDFLSGDAGTGAYYLVETVTGISQTFERFDDWWGGKPYFKTVIGKNYTDLTAMNIDYTNGDIDITFMNNSDSIARVLNGEISDTVYYNCDKNRQYGLCMVTAGDSILSDKNIRLALAHCIDMDSVVYACFGNNYEGAPATKFCIDGTLYNKEVGVYEYNPDLSMELLGNSGYSLSNPVRLKAVVADTGVNSTALETIQAYASAVGIEIDITVTKATAATAAYNSFDWPSEYDLVLVPINGFNTGEPSHILTGRIAYGMEPGTYAAMQGIDSQRLAELVEEAQSMDSAERERAYYEIEDLIHEEAWFIPLFTYSGGVFARTYLENVHLLNGYSVYWADLALKN